MNKTEFAKDFGEFFEEIKRTRVEVEARDVAMLFAIYRKDLRAKRIKDRDDREPNVEPGKEPASERQKQYLMDLAYKKGLCITQTELDRMTREQASKTIDTLLEGD